ncbi:MAG TPA: fumarate reductase/succinate dehydrogenase flavoprotein subunit, partial [Gemmata sp.]|nr:fumarate reductase/succinate dehydrogenase flavoprotein subunit [Gemmata sp.]
VVWENVGMARSKASLETAIRRIRELRAEFWQNVNVPGTDADLNVALERANRVSDYLEFGELLALDALTREESCGGHFRVEYQTPDGEAKRDDEHFCHVAAWEYAGPDKQPVRHSEPLDFEVVKLAVRSYK